MRVPRLYAIYADMENKVNENEICIEGFKEGDMVSVVPIYAGFVPDSTGVIETFKACKKVSLPGDDCAVIHKNAVKKLCLDYSGDVAYIVPIYKLT